MVGRSLADSPQPVLVKNIREGTADSGFYPEVQVAAGGRVFMTGSDAVHGDELWISDGTEAGTRLVKDIWPGREASGITEMIAAGSQVFFKAQDGVHGEELWVSDGTEAGTQMVVELREGPTGTSFIQEVAPLGEGVIFRTWRSSRFEYKLWYSDGTQAGTRVLMDIPGTGDVVPERQMHGMGEVAYAFLPSGLWKTDGTVEGTVHIADVPVYHCEMLGHVGETLYFLTWSKGPHTTALWKSDGTTAGTVLVKSMAMNLAISSSSYVRQRLVTVQGKGYFAVDTVFGNSQLSELWETDGTEVGTRRMADIPGAELEVPAGYDVSFLETTGQRVVAVMNVRDAVHGSRVWVYDPSAQTGQVVRSSNFGKIGDLACTADQIFFITQGYLMVSDGTAAGTRVQLSPTYLGFSVGGKNTYVPNLVATESEVFFMVEDEETDCELWKSDGSSAGTVPLTDRVSPASSIPRQFFSHAGGVYFASDDGLHGRELWHTDGTAEGTQMVKDITPGSGDANPRNMVAAGGQVYFLARVGEDQTVQRTNGTEEGTVGVAGFGTSAPQSLTAAGSNVFFTAMNMLWRAGESGRKMYDYLSSPRSLTAMDGWLYCVAFNPSYHSGLYRLQADVPNSLPEGVSGAGFSVLADNTLMQARPPVPGAAVEPNKHVLYLAQGHQLWRCCNGESPVLVHAFANTSHKIEKLLLQGDLVLMEVPAHPNPLWRSNGTPAGTSPLIPAAGTRLMQIVGDTIYYQGMGERLPEGLYAVNRDGTGARALSAGDNQYFLPLGVEGKTLFLARSDNGRLWTLWCTQGTPESTLEVSPMPLSINPPSGSTLPTATSTIGPDHRLYFAANSGHYGDELYSLDLNGRLKVIELEGPPYSEGRVLASGDGLSFPQERVGHQTETRILRLRNTGCRSLTNILLDLPAGADFTASLITRTPGEILPGDFGHVEISFSPKAGGMRSSTLQILATGGEALTHAVNLTGTAFGLDQAPEIRTSPASRLVLPAETLTLASEIYTAAAFTSLVWKKDGMAMPTGANTDLTYTKTGLGPSDAGVYTLTATTGAGSVTTTPAAVGVLSSVYGSITNSEGAALTLSTSGTAPVGYRLDYQWRRNGQALTDTKVLKGSRSAVLKISRAELTDEGAYDCWVTLATSAGPVMVEGVPVNRSTDEVQVTLLRRPRVQVPAEPLSWMIGETVSYQIKADWHATSFTAKGLPPGLKMSKTGLITGKPTRSLNSDATGAFLPYPVSVTATNNIGLGPAAILPIEIRAFMPAGGYDCLLDWMPSQSHGSQAKFTVTSAGAFSGQLLHCGKTYRFTSSQLKPVQGSGAGMDYHTNLGTTGSPLLLTLHAPEAEGPPWAVTLEHGGLAAVRADCRRHLFSSAQPATAFVGAFTWSLQAGEVADVPEGAGFMTATVAKTGTVNWKGKLADGTAVTGSNALSSFGSGHPTELPVHVDLHKLKGALHGAAAFVPGESSQVTVGGRFVWSKGYVYPVPKNRIYVDGFPRHEVAIEGSRYQAPGTGEYLFGIEESGVNAQATLIGPGLDLDLTQDFALSVKHSATLTAPTLSNGFFLKSLTFTAKTGAFKGSVMVLHAADPKLNRTAAFEGVIQSHNKVARGFVLLPELPAEDQPVSTIKTTPLRSVLVKVRALPRG